MLRLESLELEFWREAGRHIEAPDACQRFAEALTPHFPLQWLALFRLEEGETSLALVASAPGAPIAWTGVSSAKGSSRLIRWIEQGKMISLPARRRVPVELELLRLEQWRELSLVLLPLAGEHGSRGIAVVAAEEGKVVTSRHEEAARVMREPMSVVLDNDRRLHELMTLRQAAEADKQSLLSRLGRTDLRDTVIGEESGLRQVIERARLVQRTEVPTLILGETGTGKELIARFIHQGSARHHGPFIRVNCGAIPSELIDAQLFGHEKGGFTGAIDSRAGWFERADQGTLFLDEIGELPLDAQVRFLRVLQDGLVERVGGRESIHVDVRVVAATHRDLSQMVRGGKFREDLWYRIAVFPILLPPLRDRRQDIPELVDHFARKAAARFGLTPVKATSSDIELMQRYDWPGNVRELGAVIDRAAILGEGTSLEVAKAMGFPQPSSQGLDQPASITAPTGAKTLDEATRLFIEEALRQTHGQVEGKQGAAAILDINPHTLRARMRKLGIDWKQFRP